MAENLISILHREMELRNYSPKTIKAYVRVAKDLYQRYRRPLRNLSSEDIKAYLLEKQKGIERNSGWKKSLEKDKEFTR